MSRKGKRSIIRVEARSGACAKAGAADKKSVTEGEGKVTIHRMEKNIEGGRVQEGGERLQCPEIQWVKTEKTRNVG